MKPKCDRKYINQKYLENRLFIWGIVFLALWQIVYLMNSTVNIPVMDYWTFIVQFTEGAFDGTVTWDSLWTGTQTHRMPLTFLFYMINALLFSGNTFTGIYPAIIVTIITIIIVSREFKKDIDNNNKWVSGYILFIGYMLFSLNRWEIITLEFSVSFALRILFYVLIFRTINNLCYRTESTKKYIPEQAIAIFMIILLFSGSYFPAMVLAIATALVITLIRKKDKIQFFLYCSVLGIAVLIAAYFYLNGLVMADVNIEIELLQLLKKLVVSMLLMLASSVVHINNLTLENGIIIGCIIGLFYMGAIYIYIKNKYYEKTLLPIMLLMYSIGVMGLVCIGRAASFDLSYVMSSRYTYETIMGIIGVLWIIGMNLFSKTPQGLVDKIIKVAATFVIVVFAVISLHTNKTEWDMAVHRKAYQINLQEIARNIDEYSDEELGGFQALDPSYVREGVEILKKYKLSFFKYE